MYEAACVWKLNLKHYIFVFLEFSSKSLQADWIYRKTSASMVQETKEPGQTEYAEKVSGGQVNKHALSPLISCMHTQLQSYGEALTFLWLYEHISRGKSGLYF